MAASADISAVEERLALGDGTVRELMLALGLSQPTLSRALRELERAGRVVRMGTTRGARYGLIRSVADVGSQWPVYRINEEADVQELGRLIALERTDFFMTSGPERMCGRTTAIPYYLQDAWPTGFLGRAIPTLFPELQLPPRVVDWTEGQFFTYLMRRGSTAMGDLIVGAESLDRYFEDKDGSEVVSLEGRAAAYPRIAAAAMAGRAPGSSAHGEQPKFTVCVAQGNSRTQMIVKFSPPRATPTGERWADLLTAEHLAHRVLEEQGIPACRSSLHESEGRVFLECERFDRVGLKGRRGVVSLLAIDAARYAQLDTWTACAQRLVRDELISWDAAEHIRFLDAFGALIGNTDRHFDNISVFDRYEGRFELAPVYDMLPMLFAPQNDQIVERTFERPAEKAAWLSAWKGARALAVTYWERISEDERISRSFRQLSRDCRARLV